MLNILFRRLAFWGLMVCALPLSGLAETTVAADAAQSVASGFNASDLGLLVLLVILLVTTSRKKRNRQKKSYQPEKKKELI